MNTETIAFLGRYMAELQRIREERRERQRIYRRRRAAPSRMKAAKLLALPPK
jgi:hypothetical protein